jgi:hypothetical protein
MLQLLNCEQFKWSGSQTPPVDETVEIAGFMLMHPDTKCMTFVESEHGFLMIISISGLLLWSLGIVAVLYIIIRGRDRQKSFVTRNFGYLLEGYEPQYWYWELLVKKVDLLATALITYTSVANDPRAKILLYSVQAAIFYALQLYLAPYDNRQLKLLDRMENTGLLVRETLFTGIAFVLLFDTSASFTMGICGILVGLNAYFVLGVAIHMADDYVSTQIAITAEKRVQHMLDSKRKIVHKRRKGAIEEALTQLGTRRVTAKMRKEALSKVTFNHHVEDSEVKPKMVIEKRMHTLQWVQQHIFLGGTSDRGYRHSQLLRCVWVGPGSDAGVYVPELYEGWLSTKRSFMRGLWLRTVRTFYGMSNFSMRIALSSSFSDFVALLITLAEFKQAPSRLTDMIFFLSHAVKHLKRNMEAHPNAARPPRKAVEPGEEARHDPFTDLELLKVALLQELFGRLLFESKIKRDLLDRVHEGDLKDVLIREKVPLDAAWDVLDKLTNEQLRRTQNHPVEMYSRVEFNITLAMCSERMLDTIRKTTKEHEQEKRARKRINNFLKFHLREYLDQDPDLDWHEVHQMLNLLPVVELNRLTENPDKVVQMAKRQRQDAEAEAKEKAFEGDENDVLTVEDVNSMLMFLQKLPYDELHMIIEFTQLLLDFLSLPACAEWRKDVVERGKREEQAPDFYRGMFNLRQQLEKEEADELEEERIASITQAQESFEKDVDVMSDGPMDEQMHRMLADTAVHKPVMKPEEELRRILNDHEDPLDNSSQEGTLSLGSFESVDSGIRIPDVGTEDDGSVALGSGGSASDPLWRRIDQLRNKAAGVIDMNSINNSTPPHLRTLPGMENGHAADLSLDDMGANLARLNDLIDSFANGNRDGVDTELSM